jgi:intracellular sulfur oxidation DsrE/DsrF family protein
MKVFFAILLFALATSRAAYADTVFGTLGTGGPVIASPAPTFDHPRKVVITLSESDPARVNEVIGNVGNIQKFYGADNVRIALIVYGPGIHSVLRDQSHVTDRIKGLLAIGVHILACDATLTTLHKTQSDLIPGVETVTNGIPEIVELQMRGWIYVRP